MGATSKRHGQPSGCSATGGRRSWAPRSSASPGPVITHTEGGKQPAPRALCLAWPHTGTDSLLCGRAPRQGGPDPRTPAPWGTLISRAVGPPAGLPAQTAWSAALGVGRPLQGTGLPHLRREGSSRGLRAKHEALLHDQKDLIRWDHLFSEFSSSALLPFLREHNTRELNGKLLEKERQMLRLMTNLCQRQTSCPTHVLMTSFRQQKEKTTTQLTQNSVQMEGQGAEDSSLFRSKVIYGGRNEHKPKLLIK